MPFLKHDRITPAQVVILGFLFQILIGACLLSLPVATQSGERVPFLDALFTACLLYTSWVESIILSPMITDFIK